MSGSVSYSCVRNCQPTFAIPQNLCTLGSQAAFWDEEGISKLVSRYDKCLNVQGDYAEKQVKVCDKTCIFCFFPLSVSLYGKTFFTFRTTFVRSTWSSRQVFIYTEYDTTWINEHFSLVSTWNEKWRLSTDPIIQLPWETVCSICNTHFIPFW